MSWERVSGESVRGEASLAFFLRAVCGVGESVVSLRPFLLARPQQRAVRRKATSVSGPGKPMGGCAVRLRWGGGGGGTSSIATRAHRAWRPQSAQPAVTSRVSAQGPVSLANPVFVFCTACGVSRWASENFPLLARSLRFRGCCVPVRAESAQRVGGKQRKQHAWRLLAAVLVVLGLGRGNVRASPLAELVGCWLVGGGAVGACVFPLPTHQSVAQCAR